MSVLGMNLRIPRVGALSVLGAQSRLLAGVMGRKDGRSIEQGQRCFSVSLPARAKAKKPEVSLDEALEELKTFSKRKFKQSVDVAVRLNLDPRKPDQALRGLAVLPKGTGKDVRIAVFATGPAAEEAKQAGATIVGGDDLIDQIKNGFLEFDRCIATPAMMKQLSKVARILGPRGMMPNPKLGTVTDNVAGIIAEVKTGAPYKVDKVGNVHVSIGKEDFSNEDLKANLEAFMKTIIDNRPKGIKEPYVISAYLSKCMSPSVRLNTKEAQALGTPKVEIGIKAAADAPKKSGWIDKAKDIDWDKVDPATVVARKLRRYLEVKRELAAAKASP